MNRVGKLFLTVVLCLSISMISLAQNDAPKAKIDGSYKVTVDYSMTVEQMIAVGRYDRKNFEITDKNFPIPPSKRGKEEVTIEFVHLNRVMKSIEVLRELDKMGLRPAELPELLAFGAAYPEDQREFPIVALGSVWQDWDGNRYVPFLWGRSDERNLYLIWFDDGLSSRCRFAAVRK